MGLTEQMNTLSRMSRDTIGGAFTMSCNKSAIWQVYFFHAQQRVTGLDIEDVVEDAIKLLTDSRVPSTQHPPKKYRWE